MTASQGFLHAVVSAAGSILGNRQASRVAVILLFFFCGYYSVLVGQKTLSIYLKRNLVLGGKTVNRQ